MKEIKLTKGYVALVDDSDYEWLNQWKWCYVSGYAYRKYKKDNKWVAVRMHRIILGINDRKIFTDHINHNGLDNRRCNLRKCNNSENQKNKKSTGSSSFLGVSKHYTTYKNLSKKTGILKKYRRFGGFVAKIKANNKYIHLGLFNNEISAALAYDEAAKKYHKEFANLNFHD